MLLVFVELRSFTFRSKSLVENINKHIQHARRSGIRLVIVLEVRVAAERCLEETYATIVKIFFS